MSSAPQWVFSDAELVSQLDAELARWAGMPFFPRMAEVGVGVDCIRFAFAPLQAIGLVGPIDWPRYSIKGGGPELAAMIEQRIGAETCLRCVWRRGDSHTPAMVGDVWLADDPLHAALSGCRAEIWQSLHPHGVQHGILSERLRARARSIWRATHP